MTTNCGSAESCLLVDGRTLQNDLGWSSIGLQNNLPLSKIRFEVQHYYYALNTFLIFWLHLDVDILGWNLELWSQALWQDFAATDDDALGLLRRGLTAHFTLRGAAARVAAMGRSTVQLGELVMLGSAEMFE